MKRFVQALFVAGALLLVPALSVTEAQAAVPYGETIIQVGSSGQEVTLLQADLRVLGYFTYPTNTGYYGEITETAVKAFQQDHHLEVNGKVGLTTGPLIQQEAAQKRPAADTVGQKLVETAEKYVGVPYQWAGKSPSGFDCSGFVGYVLAQYDISVPRTAADIYQQGKGVSALKPGDLVFFNTYAAGATHVGIYVGDNNFISATTSHGVKIDSLNSQYWGARYVGARTYL